LFVFLVFFLLTILLSLLLPFTVSYWPFGIFTLSALICNFSLNIIIITSKVI
jgi:hypothetical protein